MRITGLKIFSGLVIAAVIAVIAVGFYFVGAPSTERLRKFDDARLNNLQQISNAVQTYFDSTGSVPNSFEDFQGKPSYYIQSVTDPQTGVPYEYSVKSPTSYVLCATFELPTAPEDPNVARPVAVGGAPFTQNFWKHDAGNVCFTFNLQKPAKGNCALMRDKTSGRVACFGCASRICTDPPVTYEIYTAPFEKDYIGIPYRCFESENGCALAQ